MPFEAAAQMEQDLAEDLCRDGYTVTGDISLQGVEPPPEHDSLIEFRIP
jgi:hypothetical protein